MNSCLAMSFAGILLGIPSAFAVESLCDPMRDVIKERDGELVSTTGALLVINQNMSTLNAYCNASGAKNSQRIAKGAESLSCQAQDDARTLNEQLKKVAEDCLLRYKEIQLSIATLETDFTPLHEDVGDGYEIIRTNADRMMARCPDESKTTVKLNEAYIATALSIAATQVQATVSVQNYTKFASEAGQLQALTSQRNLDCGQMGSLMAASAPVLGPQAGGAPALAKVPRGISPKTQSSITGNIDEMPLTSGEAGVKFGKPGALVLEAVATAGPVPIGDPAANYGHDAGSFSGEGYGGISTDQHYYAHSKAGAAVDSSIGNVLWSAKTEAGSTKLEIKALAADVPSVSLSIGNTEEAPYPTSHVLDSIALPAQGKIAEYVDQKVSAGDREDSLFDRIRNAYHRREENFKLETLDVLRVSQTQKF